MGQGHRKREHTPLDTALAALLALMLCLPPMGAGNVNVSIILEYSHNRCGALTTHCRARGGWGKAFVALLLAIVRASTG